MNSLKLFFIVAVTAMLIAGGVAHAGTLSCTVTTSCPTGIVVFGMKSTSNSHAEVPGGGGSYSQLVCCTGVSGLGNSCSGTFAKVLNLAKTTNSHVEEGTLSNYANPVCLSAGAGGSVSVGYQSGNCTGFDTTVGSISATTNAHVGNSGAFNLKICATGAAAATTLTQEHFNWYTNADSLTPGAALASLDTAATGIVGGAVIRLRMNLGEAGGTLAASSQAFKLQFATSTGGPWTDVGAPGAAVAWTGYNNPTPADGSTIPSVPLLVASSSVAEAYTESNPSIVNPNSIATGNWGEWDWTLQQNLSGGGATNASSGPLSTGTVTDDSANGGTATWHSPLNATSSNNVYSTTTVSGAVPRSHLLKAENFGFSIPSNATILGIAPEVEVHGTSIDSTDLTYIVKADAANLGNPEASGFGIPTSDTYLMYGASNDLWGTSWTPTDINSATFGAAFEADAGSFSSNISVDHIRITVYYSTPASAANGTYYFRMIKSGGTVLDAYTRYPSVVTQAPFASSGSLTSDIIDTAATNGVAPNSIFFEGNMPINTSVKFQFAASNSTGGPWTFTGWNPSTNSCDTSSFYTPTGPSSQIEIKASCYNNKRYIRYKMYLATTDTSASPRVDRVVLNYAP